MLAAVASLMLGSNLISAGQVVHALIDSAADLDAIVWGSRVPRTVLGIVVGLAVLAVVAGVVIYMVVGKGVVTATDVKVGDCLKEIPNDTRVLTVSTIECTQSHAGEVFAVLQMPDGKFPGQPAIEKYADRCSPELSNYAPDAMTDDTVQLYVLYPTAETWEQGDRAVTCIATLDPPRPGTIKG